MIGLLALNALLLQLKAKLCHKYGSCSLVFTTQPVKVYATIEYSYQDEI